MYYIKNYENSNNDPIFVLMQYINVYIFNSTTVTYNISLVVHMNVRIIHHSSISFYLKTSLN